MRPLGLILLLLALPRASQDPKKPPAPVSAMGGEEAATLAREISPRVEEIRGLKFKKPVPVRVVDDSAARTHFKARMQKFWPEDRVRYDQRVYEHLGLLPPRTDMVASLLDVLEEQAGGYYDPDTDTFYILGDMPRSTAPVLMAHELTHALDDQHYGIDALLDGVKEDDDRATALGAVVEGSGTVVMSLFLVRELQAGRVRPEMLQEFQKSEAGRAEKLKAAPAFLQRTLVASYTLGQAFLLRGDLTRLAAGLKAEDLDRAFRDPPVSSEQLLHPEKYWTELQRDMPRAVSLPDLSSTLGTGWSLKASGTLGELVLAVLTGAGALDLTSPEAFNPARWTNRAATGWDGDRYQHYVNGSRAVTVLATVWDSETEAQEFEAAIKPAEGRRTWRKGDAVVLVAGDAGERAAAVAEAALVAVATPPPKARPASRP